MTMKLLIGYDGSKYARDAIDHLPHAGLPSDAEAIVVSAVDVWPRIADGGDPRRQPEPETPLVRAGHALAVGAMEEAEKLAREGAERVRKLYPKWDVTFEPTSLAAGQALVEK